MISLVKSDSELLMPPVVIEVIDSKHPQYAIASRQGLFAEHLQYASASDACLVLQAWQYKTSQS